MWKCFTVPTVVFITLTSLLSGFDGIAAERWSRQVSNSEWIPLANPKAAIGRGSQSNAEGGFLSSGTHLPNPIDSLELPPALQQRYQEQLIQLQKTQESIQKLLLLQQQLKTQQQLLQSQTFLSSGFNNEDDKQSPSSLSNLGQIAPELIPEDLVPPQLSSEALPPIYPPQDFLIQRPGQIHHSTHQNQNEHREQSRPIEGQILLQHDEGVNVESTQGESLHVTKENQKPSGKHLKGQSSSELQQPVLIGNIGNEEEVQLVYVPAETLAQRNQPKRGRGRKQYPARQQHHQQYLRENQGNIEQHTSLSSPDQETFSRQVLQQIQKEHEEKAQFLKEERIKEFTRLNEEQKALERKTRLQQEAFQREQELLRQKEAEKKRKELERLEELARQRELDRIREAREKQRQEELERRRLAELRAKEDKRREEETKQREEQRKQQELEQALHQQQLLQSQQEDQLRVTSPSLLHQNSQALIREQTRRQQLSDSTRLKKIRGRQRQRTNQYQEQINRDITTTPLPNQPPLSVYMSGPTSKLEVKVADVLKILRNAKTIAVLDNVGSNSPQVFVGPSNLDPPYGYAKFDLPYLSSLDHNRVERKVDKLPFFVAPLSFDPPSGYSKIPFPAPHIGSVVVNTLVEGTIDKNMQLDEQSPNPTPLIEPNSYSDADQSSSIVTTASYDTSTTRNSSPESNLEPKYDSAYPSPSMGSRFRFKQYYDNKPASAISSSYYNEQQSGTKTKSKQYYEQDSKLTTQPPKVDTTASYRQELSYSILPNFQDRAIDPRDSSTKEQDLAVQLALINQELVQQREAQKYHAAEQYPSQSESYDVNDVHTPVGTGPTQYNLPAELPPISPHLPGLVNSLLDKQEGNLVTSTPSTTTTTTTPMTTTARVNSTTYRPRGRGRITPTRPKTTQALGKENNRTRRPYNRSKSRFSTTTEEYHESSYEPIKAKTPETTQKYNTVEHRRPVSRTQKYKSRDKTSSQSAGHNQNVQTHQGGYENYLTQNNSQASIYQANMSADAYSPSSESISFSQKQTTSSEPSDLIRENYPPTQTENYPLLRKVMVQHGEPLVSDDYSRSQNYPQNRPQDAHYHGMTYDQNSGFEQSIALEKAPVNEFNYQVGNEQSSDPRYQDKLEDTNYNPINAEDPRSTVSEKHRYSPIYEVSTPQSNYNNAIAGQGLFRNAKEGKIESHAIEADPNTSVFIPFQHSKQDYELQIPSTEITTTSTTTSAPTVIRQRVRGRLGSGRIHSNSAVQTRPRGSQDEYVRFSAINHDFGHKHHEGTRTRTRVRSQNHGSQVQTEGNEYIKIHAAQQQRLTTTTPAMTTITTTTTVSPIEEDIDYGFIRPPSFHPVHPMHPIDTRFQAPITYRPALSEVQHIIPNAEAESSSTQILKNRAKYHQTPSRRPTTKTMTTSTTSETVPIAMLDDTIYTVRPKIQPKEARPTRVRGRIRQPGTKRTTTTTESALEANNELPLDENYPRIISQQQLPLTATGQQSLYEDNFDISSQFVPNQNRPTQFYEDTTENYPPQEFILNFDNLPEQVSQREEYDQAQLTILHPAPLHPGQTPRLKYSHSTRVNPTDEKVHSASDIYGAESQWSTKLSKTSFQPSFAANRKTDESKRNRSKTRDSDQNDSENASEIITARPEVPVTVVVSSDYQKHSDGSSDVHIFDTAEVFGRKTKIQDHTERSDAITTVTNSPMLQDDTRSNEEENSTEQIDITKTTKKLIDPLTGKKMETRRRRVRVRVRPAVDDFVTAESQHYSSALNSLTQDHYKYNPLRSESKFTTAKSITTTSTTEAMEKSLLQGFLKEMLKNNEVSIPTRVMTITTELPNWTLMTTPYVISDDNNEVTTLKEDDAPIVTTLILSEADRQSTETEVNDSSAAESKDESKKASSLLRKETAPLSQEKIKEEKEAKLKKYWDKNSQEDKSQQNNLENVGIFRDIQRHEVVSNYSDSSASPEEVKDTVVELTNLSAAHEEIQKLSTVNKEKEHVMTLKQQKENVGENKLYPKNHRVKWSEVKHLSAFDKLQSTTSIPHSTVSISEVVTQDEDDVSAKTLSDYVKAIFDSMKNAEEEEVVAKVVEAKNETPADKSKLNDVAPVHEMSTKEKTEEVEEKIDTSNSSRDTFMMQHDKIEKNATNFAEAQKIMETTTRENVMTFDITTSIPDVAIANIMVPSKETETTAPTTRTTTSNRQTTTDNNAITTNFTETMLGKVLRTSTTTKVSHMTEICYRGRCVMTRPKMEEATR